MDIERNNELRLIFFYLIIIITLLSLLACDKTDELITEKQKIIVESCDNGFEIIIGNYIIQNNKWGENNFPGNQCVWLMGPDTLFGWNWSYPNNDNEYKYPEIITGRKPWGPNTNYPNLPGVIETIKNINVSFDTKIESDGKNNLAFDIWVHNTNQKNNISPDNILAEIMIWVNDNNLCCWGEKQGEVSFDNFEYEIYKTELSHIPGDNYYILFYSKVPMLNQQINIMNFINYTVQKGWISEKNVVSSIEFGTEIVEGTGRIEISKYAVEIDMIK